MSRVCSSKSSFATEMDSGWSRFCQSFRTKPIAFSASNSAFPDRAVRAVCKLCLPWSQATSCAAWRTYSFSNLAPSTSSNLWLRCRLVPTVGLLTSNWQRPLSKRAHFEAYPHRGSAAAAGGRFGIASKTSSDSGESSSSIWFCSRRMLFHVMCRKGVCFRA